MIFDRIKNLIKRKDINDIEDFSLESGEFDRSFGINTNTNNINNELKQNFQENFPKFEEIDKPFVTPPPMPQIQGYSINYQDIEYLKQQLQMISTKLDNISYKVDMLIQRLNMLEQYFYYRR